MNDVLSSGKVRLVKLEPYCNEAGTRYGLSALHYYRAL